MVASSQKGMRGIISAAALAKTMNLTAKKMGVSEHTPTTEKRHNSMRRARNAFKPRHIAPESVNIGSIIMVTWKEHGLVKTIMGRVHSRDNRQAFTCYYNEAGKDLFAYHSGGMRIPTECTITEIEPAPTLEELTLF